MFNIGYRTIKTAVGAAVAIAIAQSLQLDFYGAAGILTALCISKTRRDSLIVSWQRFVSCVIGLVFAIVFFEVIGYHPVTIALLLLFFIPIAVKLRAKEGIVTSFVIILHVYTVQSISIALIINELVLITIGIGVALIMNLYMPSVEKELKKYQDQIEANFKEILMELTIYLRNGNSQWDGKEIPETVELLDKAKNIAFTNIENHLLRYEDQYFHYFKMREKQFEIIERIIPFVSSIDAKVTQAEQLAEILEEMSESVSPKNNAMYFLQKLSELREKFELAELPKDRQEFAVRSSLAYIMHEIEQYLIIKDTLSSKGEAELKE